ncbi:hypothetical protein N9346_01645 [Gammaproteobacteria bacterium]|nr:hypothetical protein [Gammaproteobacteria bacterium]MDG1120351.1 hypothetical protein [SAR86 cluster bacterium]MDG1230587.1 hypothetical protein [SAR86 cluster bacterium]|tara:strand:- start:1560 stop:2159 length:600 start_codon:yes stop_codon:yes gene_type:complete
MIHNPLFIKSKERSLSNRQKKALADLEGLIKSGTPQLTMSEIATNLNVSLRDLYEIASTKEELILLAVESLLMKIGADKEKAINLTDSPIAKIYLLMEQIEMQREILLVSQKTFKRINGLKDFMDSYENYYIEVIKKYLEKAIISNEIVSIDTSAMAIILSGLSRDLDKKYLKKEDKMIPSNALHKIIEVIFKGLKITE